MQFYQHEIPGRFCSLLTLLLLHYVITLSINTLKQSYTHVLQFELKRYFEVDKL